MGKPCDAYYEELTNIDEGLRQLYTIPAKVLKGNSPKIFKRFGIKKVPTTLLFSRTKMFAYPGSEANGLLEWVEAGPAPETGVKVPPEPTFVSELMDQVKAFFSGK